MALDYGTPKQRPIGEMTIEEAEAYLSEGQFPAGSMGPKIAAAIRFLRGDGEPVIISSLRRVGTALAGNHGTRIVSASVPAGATGRR